MSSAAALIVAAGRGCRAGGATPKQYARIAGDMVLTRTLRAFTAHPGVGPVLAVIHPDDQALYRQAARGLEERLLPPALGGATRQASVLAGLAQLSATSPDVVLIHDAARPFVAAAVIDRVLAALAGGQFAGAIAALPLADAVKRAAGGLPPTLITASLERAQLWRAQTPQGFAFASIFDAHRRAAEGGRGNAADDAEVAAWVGLDVVLVPGAEANRKLTTAEDIAMADRELSDSRSRADIRVGTGFDVHRFGPGDRLWLCGVEIPHSHGLVGHSDADVALHALTDAILGAIADGDIGQHFPPNDARWKGAASAQFLADAARRVSALGGEIAHADVTILCEAPRIAPHRYAMRARIAGVLDLPLARISVKATTTEGLGFLGRAEGIAAQAAATVRLPASPDNI